MDCTYKGVGGRVVEGWAAGGGLYLPIGLLEHLCVQEVLVIDPDKPTRYLTNTGVNIRSIYLLSSAVHGPHCLSHDLTRLAKSALKTDQLTTSVTVHR